MADSVFGRGDVLEGAAEMHRGRPRAIRGLPRNGAVQRVVDFENTRAVAVFREATGEWRGETVACDAQQLVGGDIAEDGVVLLNRGQILDTRRSVDCAAERRKVP